MRIRIWGARGSIPASLKSEEVEDKIRRAILGLPAGIDTRDEEAVWAYVRGLPPLLRGTAGANTPCVEIRAGEDLIIVDAGTGISALGEELLKGPFGRGEGTAHLVMSHLHWDHIQGYPMFMPAFVPGNRIFIYGIHDVKKALEKQQSSPTWPASMHMMQAEIEFVSLELGVPFSIGNVRINTIRNTHPNRSYSFRFEDQHSVFVYASDAEYKDLNDASVQPHIEFFRGADALIFDAQYTLTQSWKNVDWGHSSAMIGVDLARAAGVKRLLLFHHHPTHSDAELEEILATAIAYQAEDTSLPTCEIHLAYQGLTIDLAPPGAVDLQFTPDGEAAILTPASVFDERGVDQLAQQMAQLAEKDSLASSIIDLSQVETLTTASLKALVALRQEREGKPIVLVGPSNSVRQVIKLGGCLDYFAIYPSVAAALEAAQAREALNLPGHVIRDRYQILNTAGESPLGTVLTAIDTDEDRTVALKVLSPAFSEETITRFAGQVRRTMNLDHRNIVKVLDWDSNEDYSFKVEEFTDLPTLQDLLVERDTLLPIEQAIGIVVDTIDALEYAHSWGVIHGDLKPHNIFLADDGVRVGGFGLGLLEEGHSLLNVPLILLSASYLAPEQILGQPLDARTDLYALGVIMYRLFTGHLPFDGFSREVMLAHLDQKPRPPRTLNPHLSQFLEHVILKLLAKDSHDRYESAQQVRRVLARLIVGAENDRRQGRFTLVGREEPLRILQECWEKARAGQGQLAFITGESGVGKTSLAHQFVAQSGAQLAFTGRSQGFEGSPPYQVFSDVLRTYVAGASLESFDAEDRHLLGDFIHIMPEIRLLLSDLPQPTRLEPAQEQLRFVASAIRFIERATQRQPWLIILDDLQWADQSSLELLGNLGRHLSSMALLIIGIYTDVELKRGHPLLDTVYNLRASSIYRHLPLECLDAGEVGQVLKELWSQPPPDVLSTKIHQHTGGNPLFVGEVARGMVDDGLVYLRDGRWHFPDLEEVRLPQDLREAIWRRVRHLNPDTQTLVRQASVLGHTFRLDDLKAMPGLSGGGLLDHLDLALERQLVRESPGEGFFAFCHSEIQEVLYLDVGARWRQLLHRYAGEAIERRAKRESGPLDEVLAYHFREAGEIERAVSYGFRAARRAQSANANWAALMWYTETLEMLDQLDPEVAPLSEDLRLSAHKSLSEVLTQIGQYDEALEHYASVLFKWLGRGPQDISETEPRVEIVRIYLFGAELYYRQGDYDEAIAWCQKSLDIVSRIDTYEGQQVRGRAYDLLGDICVRSGDLTYAAQFRHESVRTYEEIGDLAGQANATNGLGVVYYYQGDWGRAVDAYRNSLMLRQEVGDVSGQGETKNNLALVHLDWGEWEQAKSLLEESRAIYGQIGAVEQEARVLSNLAQVFIYQEDWSGALHHLNLSQAAFIQAISDEYLAELNRRWSELYLGTGDLDKALDYALRSVELAIEAADLLEEGRSCRDLGRIHLARGEWEPAEAILGQSLQIFEDLETKYESAKTRLALVQVAMEAGLGDEASDLLAQAIQVFEELGAQADLAAARELAGQD
jgi:anti-anti-sigma factor